ncbi:MAG: type I-E CRISPR-associated protein Cse2/CasB [Gammaproteobacteria bacterium]
MQGLLEFLRRRKEDRGLMADLRCALVDSKRQRAWPYLAAFNGIGDDSNALTVQTIAGMYAMHPKESTNEKFDFGVLCLRLCTKEEVEKIATAEGVGPVTRRFQHLLAAEGEEIFPRVVRLMLRAKAEDIPVNYERLFKDLRAWQYRADQVRTEWAKSFWTPSVETEEAP